MANNVISGDKVNRHFALDFRVWDIGRGSAMHLNAAGQQDVVFDLGSDDFSPMDCLASGLYGLNRIDLLCITHPHHDHISDIQRMYEHGVTPRLLHRSKGTRELVDQKVSEEKGKQNPNESYIADAEAYLKLDSKYQSTASEDPSDLGWANGVTVSVHGVEDELLGSERYEQMNNASSIAIVERYGFKIVITGDNMDENLSMMMDDSEVSESIENADILVAPHHGRSSSYDYDFVSHVNPELVIFSDTKDNGNNEDMYYHHATGMDVYDEYNETVDEDRSVLTTRNDGRIRVQANKASDFAISYRRNYAEDRVTSRRAYQKMHSE